MAIHDEKGLPSFTSKKQPPGLCMTRCMTGFILSVTVTVPWADTVVITQSLPQASRSEVNRPKALVHTSPAETWLFLPSIETRSLSHLKIILVVIHWPGPSS